jgi:anti-sigma-K factor RskA
MKEEPDNLDPELLLTQYLDGQLDADQRRRVQRRLETDADLLAQAKLYEALDQQLDALATAKVDGVDYDLQRQQIMASIERKILLSPRPAVHIFFRPVFRVAAIAATAIIAVSLYMHLVPRGGTLPTLPVRTHNDAAVSMAIHHTDTPNGGSIEVGISRPGKMDDSQVSVESGPAKLDDFALAGPGQQIAQAPSGTVIASFDRARANRATADVFMFPPTESSADSGDIK